jgi:hypothetical protein
MVLVYLDKLSTRSRQSEFEVQISAAKKENENALRFAKGMV